MPAPTPVLIANNISRSPSFGERQQLAEDGSMLDAGLQAAHDNGEYLLLQKRAAPDH